MNYHPRMAEHGLRRHCMFSPAEMMAPSRGPMELRWTHTEIFLARRKMAEMPAFYRQVAECSTKSRLSDDFLNRVAAEEVDQLNDEDDDHHQFENESTALVELIHHEAVEVFGGL